MADNNVKGGELPVPEEEVEVRVNSSPKFVETSTSNVNVNANADGHKVSAETSDVATETNEGAEGPASAQGMVYLTVVVARYHRHPPEIEKLIQFPR